MVVVVNTKSAKKIVQQGSKAKCVYRHTHTHTRLSGTLQKNCTNILGEYLYFIHLVHVWRKLWIWTIHNKIRLTIIIPLFPLSMIIAKAPNWTSYFVNEYNLGKCLLLSLKAVLLITYRYFKIKMHQFTVNCFVWMWNMASCSEKTSFADVWKRNAWKILGCKRSLLKEKLKNFIT